MIVGPHIVINLENLTCDAETPNRNPMQRVL